jgi:WD40 repeat protein
MSKESSSTSDKDILKVNNEKHQNQKKVNERTTPSNYKKKILIIIGKIFTFKYIMFMIIIFLIMGVIIFLMFVSGPLNPSASETPTITVANAGSVDQVRWANPFGSPENLALSPDWKTLAVATAFNILVYDLSNLEAPLFELEGQKTPSRVMFSPDGQILASAGSSSDGTIWLWDMPMGGVKRAVLEGHTEAIYGIDFSPNGMVVSPSLYSAK